MEVNFDTWMLTEQDLAEYEEFQGKKGAAALLLLTPPDRFAGDYEKTLSRLTTVLTTKQHAKTHKNDTF